MERRVVGQKVGSIFPFSPDERGKIPCQFGTLIEIYQTVSKFYNYGEWTMKDFKSFRSKLAPRSIDEISYLEGFITAFLSLSKEKREVIAKSIDENFKFSILVERKKIVTTDEETKQKKECYCRVGRPFEMGDIVTFSNAIWAETVRLVTIDTSNVLNEMLKDVPSHEQLSVLTELLDFHDQLLETVLSDFDIHFDGLLKMPKFAAPLLIQRENVPLWIQETIRKRILAVENENGYVIKSYLSVSKSNYKLKIAKQKKRQEGYRLP